MEIFAYLEFGKMVEAPLAIYTKTENEKSNYITTQFFALYLSWFICCLHVVKALRFIDKETAFFIFKPKIDSSKLEYKRIIKFTLITTQERNLLQHYALWIYILFYVTIIPNLNTVYVSLLIFMIFISKHFYTRI